jgi:VanZ family protein
LNITFWKTRTFWWYWLPPLAWCGMVLIISGDLGSGKNTLGVLKWLLSWLPLNQVQFNQLNSYIRKTIGHFGNYGFLGFLWFRAFREQPGSPPGRAFLWSMLFCLAVALMDEGHQAMFASRGSSLRDVALDMSGAATLGLISAVFWERRLRLAAGK